VEISSIVIDSPRITYETNLRNDNIRALLRNVSGEGSADEPVDDTSSPGKDLLIREFRMLNPQLDVVTQIASAPIAMPDIVINDIGTGENGVSAEELLRLVLGRVNRAIVEGNFPSVEQLRDQIEGNFRERVEDTVEDLGNRIRDIFN
jgi:hypothetical protein